MPCKKECFETAIISCSEDIILRAGLSGNTEYYWLLTDRHGNLTQRKVTTNSSGDLVIDHNTLPVGLNRHSGNLTLSLRLGSDYLTAVILTFGVEEYSCVSLSLFNIDMNPDDNSPVNVIEFTGSVVPDGVQTLDGHLELTGSVDSDIPFPDPYINGTVAVYKNGVRLGNAAFSPATDTTITLNVPREIDDEFIIDFKYLS